ncbi:alpha/beta fold hydrolase [Nocardia gamkensis]|uniref:Alpha/beta hydrolase n=1 Tax=Nocardia gamkensis TaxID=352869 RepID=A0A7X6R4F4_9NOCA|nr:alpha/beta fold hydrolase [Nocardia gamkensis]NKY28419.1 alpha/beta hydrolase [Nocardia gamkensis]NQE69199.1 Dihydrolipoyllysine-residue acetyltransferase [Nocardia gamkensis]
MTTFVLIPGMCHGGWCFEQLTEQLRAHGHRVYPLTLSGVGERVHLRHGVNLDTHIQDVTALLSAENITDAVLVGHSYGGMVITGAADRAASRVAALVYIDAVVPQSGDSCFTLVSDQERRWYLDVVDTGDAVRPLPFFDARATPHPLASVLQPLTLTGDLTHIRRRDYVYATGWEAPSPFTGIYQRLRHDAGWTTHAVDGGHNLMRDAPEDLLRILLDVPGPR